MYWPTCPPQHVVCRTQASIYQRVQNTLRWYHPSPELLDAADAAWHAAAKVNKELEELEPVILAPTSIQPYTVASNGHNVTQTPIRESQAAKPHKSSCMHPQLALLFVVFIWV